MAAAGVRQAQSQPHLREVCVYRLNFAGLEVNIYGVADGAGELIHKAAGLSEVLLLRLLCDPRENDWGDLAVIIKLAQNPSYHNRERGRGAEPGACGQRGADARAKAADVQAVILKRGDNAAHECRRRAELGRAHCGMFDVHLKRLESLGRDDRE